MEVIFLVFHVRPFLNHSRMLRPIVFNDKRASGFGAIVGMSTKRTSVATPVRKPGTRLVKPDNVSCPREPIEAFNRQGAFIVPRRPIDSGRAALGERLQIDRALIRVRGSPLQSQSEQTPLPKSSHQHSQVPPAAGQSLEASLSQPMLRQEPAFATGSGRPGLPG
jgi:hypothetical protein